MNERLEVAEEKRKREEREDAEQEPIRRWCIADCLKPFSFPLKRCLPVKTCLIEHLKRVRPFSPFQFSDPTLSHNHPHWDFHLVVADSVALAPSPRRQDESSLNKRVIRAMLSEKRPLPYRRKISNTNLDTCTKGDIVSRH